MCRRPGNAERAAGLPRGLKADDGPSEESWRYGPGTRTRLCAPARPACGGTRLIVECKACTTRFQLDESRVPLSGIRVRCSRCKKAFFLAHPEASRDEHALETQSKPGGVASPGSTQELVDPSASFEAAVADAGSEAVAPGADDEEEWEFNVDDADADVDAEDGMLEGLSAFDGDFDGEFDPDEGSGLELGGDAPGAATMQSAPPDPAADDASAQETASPSDPPDPAEALARSIAEELEAEPDADVYDAQVPGEAPAPGPPPDLGEPEDWDFLGSEREAVATPAAPVSMMRPAAAETAPAALPDVPLLDPTPPSRAPAWARRTASAGGWAVVAGLVASALGAGLGPTLRTGPLARPADAAPASTVEVGGHRAESLSVAWVPTASGEEVLAVAGSWAGERPAGTVDVELLDAHGQPLDLPRVAAGAPVGERALREANPAMLREIQMRADARAGFAAYLHDVPAEAARARLVLRPHAPPIPPSATADETGVAGAVQPVGTTGPPPTAAPREQADGLAVIPSTAVRGDVRDRSQEPSRGFVSGAGDALAAPPASPATSPTSRR